VVPKKGIPPIRNSQVLAPNERKVEKQRRDTEKKSATFISSRSLLGRGHLRPWPSEYHYERGESMLLLQAGVLNTLWWEKGGWRGMDIR
jgi:hypothetical protein